MVQKPKIQYIGQFYVYGSEARQLEEEPEQKKPKTKLPKIRLERFQKLYIDPVAMAGLLVAAVMMVVLAMGVVNLNRSWKEYTAMSTYLTELRRVNADLSHAYHTGFDPEAIQETARNAGYIDAEDANYMIFNVRMPAPKTEPTMWEDIVWFCKGLFREIDPATLVE